MAAALPLLLFCSWLYVARAQHSYFDLSTVHKGGVELALNHLKQKDLPFHYRFYGTEGLHEKQAGNILYVQHRLSLKPTTCAKGTIDTQQTCPYREDRVMMDCGVCYKTVSNQIQQTPQPYVHCVAAPRLTQNIQNTRRTTCDGMTAEVTEEYLVGSVSFMPF